MAQDDQVPHVNETDPKLYVDVNIGQRGTRRIVVYEGDTAEKLAHDFCEAHGLLEMEDKLRAMLER